MSADKYTLDSLMIACDGKPYCAVAPVYVLAAYPVAMVAAVDGPATQKRADHVVAALRLMDRAKADLVAPDSLWAILDANWAARDKAIDELDGLSSAMDAAEQDRDDAGALADAYKAERDDIRATRDELEGERALLIRQRDMLVKSARDLEVLAHDRAAIIEAQRREMDWMASALAAAEWERDEFSRSHNRVRALYREAEQDRDEARALLPELSEQANRLGAELAAGPKRAALYLALRESGRYKPRVGGVGWSVLCGDRIAPCDADRDALDAAAARLAGWGDAQANALREETDPDRRDAARYRALRAAAERGMMVVSPGGDTMDEAADALVRAQS